MQPTPPTSDKDAAYRLIRQRVRARHARIAMALGIFALTACADDAGPAQKARSEKPAMTDMAELTGQGFIISRIEGLPPEETTTLTELLWQEAANRHLPIHAKDGPAFRIHGAVGAGPNAMGIYVVTIIDVSDIKGNRLYRFTNESVLPETAAWSATDPWASITKDDLRLIAQNAAGKLAKWYEARQRGATPLLASATSLPASDPDADVITGSIDPSADTPRAPIDAPMSIRSAMPYTVEVSPAPGDGDRALAAALEEALARRLKPDTIASPLRLTGEVTTASRSDGRTDISISWRVTTLQGELLGTITQTNAMNPDRIAGRWGNVATDAAESAADGLVALMSPASSRS